MIPEVFEFNIETMVQQVTYKFTISAASYGTKGPESMAVYYRTSKFDELGKTFKTVSALRVAQLSPTQIRSVLISVF